MRTNVTALIVMLFGIFIQPPSGNINNMELNGGTLTAESSTTICTSSPSDSKIKLIVTGEEGKSFTFIMADPDNIIGTIQKSKVFNFKNATPGIRTIYHVSYEKKDFNASEGMNMDDISGTYHLSNPLEVSLGDPESPVITLPEGGTEASICAGDEDQAPLEVIIDGEEPENMAWLITDKKGVILDTPDSPPFDLSEIEEAECAIYLVSYMGEISGLEAGSRVKKIEGCHALSNEISVIKEDPEAGTLEGDSLFFCVGNNSPDKIHGNDIRLTGTKKAKGKWIITDTSGIILALPKNPQQTNFDDWEAGICLIWHLASSGNLEGLEIGLDIDDLEGCYDLSNSIAIVKTLANGGHLDNGIVKACSSGDEGLFLNEDDFILTDTSGSNFSWVVTERNKTIVGFGDSLSNIDLSESGLDKFFVYFLSYSDDFDGLEIGNRISDLTGCFDLSNKVPVNVENPIAGELSGDVTISCGEEGQQIDTSNLTLEGAEGGQSVWVITDQEGNIISISPEINEINLENLDTSDYTLYHITYSGSLEGLEEGGNIEDLDGCFDLSSGVIVNVENIEPATLEGGPFLLCVEGEEAFLEPGSITFADGDADTSVWVITDTSGIILGLPDSPDSVNFAQAGAGICLVWRISYNGEISGLEVGNSIDGLEGCYVFSNGIEVIREAPDGGIVEGGPFGICSDSTELEVLEEGAITLSGNTGSNAIWVITDTSGVILALSESPYEVNYNALGPGECLIWHLSFAEGLTGLSVGNNASDLEGCYDLSNSLTLIKGQADAGEITGGPFSFCNGDGIQDTIPSGEVVLTGNTGDTSVWVVTDTSGIILALPDSLEEVNFEDAEPGICLIWHLTFSEISGLELGNNVSQLEGCFDFSNSIEVIRSQPLGGNLDGGPFSFCVGDGEVDTIPSDELILFDDQGSFKQWVITDTGGLILGLAENITDVNFDGAGEGECFVWNISYEAGLEGLEVDSLIGNIQGCHDISDSVVVERSYVDGGLISLDSISTDTTVCVDDGIADSLNLVLIEPSGDSSIWVVTNEEGIITEVSDSSIFSLEGTEAGVVQIWHISIIGEAEGIEVDSNINNVSGCMDLSNAVTVTKLSGEDCGTGLQETENLEVRALQNPISEELTLSLNSERSMGIGQLTVRSVEGQTVISRTIRMVEDLYQQIQLDLNSLREGMYFVSVKFPGGMKTIKIIKQ